MHTHQSQDKNSIAKTKIDIRFESFRDKEASQKGLRGFFNRLDRWIFRNETELLEKPGVPVEKQSYLVNELTRLNDRSGYHKIFISFLSKLIRKTEQKEKRETPVKILDVGAGGGGLLRAIFYWAKRKKIDVELSGLDFSEHFVRVTQAKFAEEGIPVRMFQSNAATLENFEDNSFDFVLSSYMIHHIQSAAALASFFKHARRIARRGWLIADFDRRFYGPLFAKWSGRFFGGPSDLVEDGVKSARRAYTDSEINYLLRDIAGLAGVSCTPLFLLPYWVIEGINTVALL